MQINRLDRLFYFQFYKRSYVLFWRRKGPWLVSGLLQHA